MPSQHAFYLVGINISGADVEASFGGATGSAGILSAAQSGFWAVGMDVGDLWMWLQLIWADLREDKRTNPAPGFSFDCWPSGAAEGPGSPGNGSDSNIIAGCTTKQPRTPNLRHIRGRIVAVGVGRRG